MILEVEEFWNYLADNNSNMNLFLNTMYHSCNYVMTAILLTRWTVRVDPIFGMLSNYKLLMEVLLNALDDVEAEARPRIRGARHQMVIEKTFIGQ